MEWSIPHILTFEDRLQVLANDDYAIAQQNLWWDRLMSEITSTGRKEIFEFLLTTADIHKLDRGQMVYDDMVSAAFEATNEDFGAGTKVSRNQFSDNEIKKATAWASQMGTAMAMTPQYQLISLLENGETGLAFDGKAFFATDHPVNPFSGSDTYSNLLTGASYAIRDTNGNPIPDGFMAVKAAIRGFKMPNGRNRNLVPNVLVVPPQLEKVGLEITQAKIISATENMVANGSGAVINGKVNTGVELIVINELGEISAEDYYVGVSTAGTKWLPFVHQLREAYYMNSYNGMTQVELNIRNELEWHVRGRNTSFYGLPYQLIKAKP